MNWLLVVIAAQGIAICVLVLRLLKKRGSLDNIKDLQIQVKELTLREQQASERYRILTTHVPAGVIIHDTKGVVTWVSPYTEVLTGFSTSEILAKPNEFLSSLVHDEDKDLFARALGVAAQGEAYQYRFRFYHKSGLVMWAEMRTVPLLDEESNSYMALSIMLDVTGSVLHQQSVEERNRELHDFTYMISHDLKAPIFTIKGMLGVIREDSASNKATDKEALEHIDRAAKRLEQLVSGILELAQASSTEAKLGQVALKEILQEVSQDLSPQLKSVSGTLNIDQTLPEVMGSKTQLYQIFSNLIGNAIKYRNPDRPLKIEVKLGTSPNSRKTSILVLDNGMGIPENLKETLFKPFSRGVKHTAEGSGVGLACVQRLVNKLGGKVSLDQASDQGSTFKVELRLPRGSSVSLSHKGTL